MLAGLLVLPAALVILALGGLGLAAGAEDAPLLQVSPEGRARIAGQSFRCSLGGGGVRQDKREGDGTTPAGDFPLRQAFYRPDRLPAPPMTGLTLKALAPDDGWCDDPAHLQYNRLVRLPFPAGHERLWRQDGLYDLVVVVGYNDDPPVPGRGSAIFLHVARPDYGPTAGCVAFAKEDLLAIMRLLQPGSRVVIQEKAGP